MEGGGAGASQTVSAIPGVSVRSMEIHGFTPDQVVSEGGNVWLVGATSPQSTGCKIESVNPSTLRTHRYSLIACGGYVTTGDNAIYLVAPTYERGTNDENLHIERFDPTTGGSVVMAPVIMTLVGSAIAHIAFAYADRSLWVRGYGSPGTPANGMVQVAPSTGVVLRTFSDDAWPILKDEPSVVGNGDTLWLASGLGATETMVASLSPGQANPTTVYSEDHSGGVEWLSSVQGQVWANIRTDRLAHLVLLSSAGAPLMESGSQLLGDAPLVSTGKDLWTSGVGANCLGPLEVWQVSRTTGKATVAVAVHTSANPCVAASGIAAAGRSAFLLIGSPSPVRLYRIGSN